MAHQRRMGRPLVALAALAMVAAACTSTQGTDEPSEEPRTVSEFSIPNEGGEGEGHTPIGFPGVGTGLFVGDNLNSGFPDGDGVQTYMTFPLPDIQDTTGATLSSDLLQTRGTPFNDLGALMAERVIYDDFGPALFDLPSSGAQTRCTVIDGAGVSCDVTTAVQAAIDDGAPSVQFRLRFERIADNDGQPDLAMFYRTDSNTNEEGLFALVVTGG